MNNELDNQERMKFYLNDSGSGLDQGPTGPVGPTGPQGAMGPTGFTGHQGAVGNGPEYSTNYITCYTTTSTIATTSGTLVTGWETADSSGNLITATSNYITLTGLFRSYLIRYQASVSGDGGNAVIGLTLDDALIPATKMSGRSYNPNEIFPLSGWTIVAMEGPSRNLGMKLYLGGTKTAAAVPNSSTALITIFPLS